MPRESGSSKRKRQTLISLSPLPTSSAAALDYNEQIKERAAAVRYGHAHPRSVGSAAKRQKMMPRSTPTTYEQTVFPTPSTMAQPSRSDIDKRARKEEKRRRKAERRQQKLDFSNAVPASTIPDLSGRTQSELLSSEDDQVPSKQKGKRPAKSFMAPSSSSARQAMPTPDSEEEVVNEISSEDTDDMPTTLGKRQRAKPSSPIRSSPPVESDDDVVLTQHRVRRASPKQHTDLDEDSDDDIVTPVRSRRLVKRPQLTEQDQEDLQSDLEFLGNTSDVDSPRQPRSSQSFKKTARAAALDALRRKRAGVTHEEPEESEHGTSSDEGAVPASSRAMFHADEEDDDFLDDNADDPLGAPDADANMPIEFTRYASMKAKDLFKHAVEWMVQKKINPAFRAEDELYAMAFKKLNDEVQGLVGSKFSSSAWTPDFVRSLQARPEIAVSQGFSEFEHCEACNRKGHPATYEISFTGVPYHPTSLDPVDNGSESESDEEGTRDHRGNVIPAAGIIYHVGRFCMANAETAHELQHWKKHLFDWVVDWLDQQKYLKARKIVERDSWSTKKRRKDANKIADRMEAEGVTRQLWKEFSESIARARDSKQTYLR